VFVAARELGRAGVQSAYADALLAGSLLAAAGDDLLGPAVAGESLVLPALAEPGRDFAPVPGGTSAGEGPDGWTVSGFKGPIPFGHAATHAVVSARAGDETVLLVVDDPRVEDDVLVLEQAAGAYSCAGRPPTRHCGTLSPWRRWCSAARRWARWSPR
jgi:alkylation response protein AidB-like acyl-CoA dehydrogenase